MEFVVEEPHDWIFSSLAEVECLRDDNKYFCDVSRLTFLFFFTFFSLSVWSEGYCRHDFVCVSMNFFRKFILDRDVPCAV